MAMDLDDFRRELQARGFNGFDSEYLDRYINWGGREVARLAGWTWEEAEATLNFAVGDYRKPLTDLAGFQGIRFVEITTADYEAKLERLDPDVYRDEWSAINLGAVGNREEPSAYHLTGTYLYVIPPPVSARAVRVHYWKGWVDLVNPGDVPVTPVDYEEAILYAAEVRGHIRARQPELAAVARAELSAFFDDKLANEVMRDSELEDRVEPDPSWPY